MLMQKMGPDITLAQRAQHRVADRVQQSVGVRVSLQATLEGNRHATQYQISTGHERMHVQTIADANVHSRFRSRWASIAAASSRSSGYVTLMLAGLPCTSRGLSPSVSTACASSVMAERSACRNAWLRIA